MENELQALVTGVVVGGLFSVQKKFLLVDVEPLYDDEGNALPEVMVYGKATGTQLKVKVEVVE